jgi:hypothetical protein
MKKAILWEAMLASLAGTASSVAQVQDKQPTSREVIVEIGSDTRHSNRQGRKNARGGLRRLLRACRSNSCRQSSPSGQ